MATLTIFFLIMAAFVTSGYSLPGPTVAAVPAADTVQLDCLAPPETGPCKAKLRMYFYSNLTLQCNHFLFGGCDGNTNRFLTEDDCRKHCLREDRESVHPNSVHSTNVDPCSLPAETGPCPSRLTRYHHQGGICNQFIFGGCGGNDNNFKTVEDCLRTCVPNADRT